MSMAGHLLKSLLVLCSVAGMCRSGTAAENDNSLTIPEYILPCSRSDPQLDACVKRSFNHLRPYLARGLPELGVPAVEPLLIDRLVMANDAGPVRVTASFTNITVLGPSNYTVTKIRSDLSKLRIDMGLVLPRIEITGRYEVSGQVLLFPVRSQGDFWAAFIDVAAIAKVFGKEIERDNVKYMAADRLLVDFKLRNSRFKVRDTVNYGSVIGEAMNQFLNNNAAEIIEEMRPAASVAIAKHFQAFLNAAFTKVPIDVWLKP
ncbi:protein takeout-like [Leguminivora glycinivorella]|uniref:protein takeout-like n=1 Tax=Leguminivora glycinivorella TaxID=1035111 RepID=UPI00200E2F09|nr:protein takeout-like [Leguminivora glycinivorella]